MKVDPSSTLHDVVAENHRAAFVFQKYGIDFCGGSGASTIEHACGSMGVNARHLLTDLQEILAASVPGMSQARKWDADFLAEYIIQNHHRYVRSVSPSIFRYALKVARTHGPIDPNLIEVAKIVTLIIDDMESHIQKEEEILFPYIKALAKAHRNEAAWPPAPFGNIQNLLEAMDMEHENVEEWMKEIRELTNGYTPPSDACLTYRVLLRELEEFERDLRLHVHLEDDILFPKAIAIEARWRRTLGTSS